MSKVKVQKIPDQEYTGEAVNVEELLVLMDKNKSLVYGSDYEVSYEPCIDVGTHEIVIVGKGDYAGVIRTSFKISGISMSTLSLFTFMHLRMKWQPTPVYLPGESQG